MLSDTAVYSNNGPSIDHDAILDMCPRGHRCVGVNDAREGPSELRHLGNEFLPLGRPDGTDQVKSIAATRQVLDPEDRRPVEIPAALSSVDAFDKTSYNKFTRRSSDIGDLLPESARAKYYEITFLQ